MLSFKLIKRCIIICVLGVLYSGCYSDRAATYRPEKLKKLNKGVVFLSMTWDDSSLSFEIKKLGSNKGIKIPRARTGPLYKTRNILFLDPGLYYINYIKLNEDGTYYLPAPGINNNVVEYGAFEVSANQVYFFGNLTYSDDSHKFTLSQDRKLIDTQLNQPMYKDLFDNIKIGKFYQRGSLINQNDDRSYQILDKQKIDNFYNEITKKIIEMNESGR
jgi:hypothetical protein